MWRPSSDWDENVVAWVKQCAADRRYRESGLAAVMMSMFEAGTDTMLDALRKSGTPSKGGTWVFIPDEPTDEPAPMWAKD